MWKDGVSRVHRTEGCGAMQSASFVLVAMAESRTFLHSRWLLERSGFVWVRGISGGWPWRQFRNSLAQRKLAGFFPATPPPEMVQAARSGSRSSTDPAKDEVRTRQDLRTPCFPKPDISSEVVRR